MAFVTDVTARRHCCVARVSHSRSSVGNPGTSPQPHRRAALHSMRAIGSHHWDTSQEAASSPLSTSSVGAVVVSGTSSSTASGAARFPCPDWHAATIVTTPAHHHPVVRLIVLSPPTLPWCQRPSSFPLAPRHRDDHFSRSSRSRFEGEPCETIVSRRRSLVGIGRSSGSPRASGAARDSSGQAGQSCSRRMAPSRRFASCRAFPALVRPSLRSGSVASTVAPGKSWAVNALAQLKYLTRHV